MPHYNHCISTRISSYFHSMPHINYCITCITSAAAVTVEAVKQQAVTWMESLQEGLASDPPEWVQTIADDIALATAFWR